MVVAFLCHFLTFIYLSLSHDVASESDITLCNKINRPLVVYRLSGNVLTSIITLRKRWQILDVLQLDATNEGQEVSPFSAGDHKAQINRRAQRHNKHKTEKNT